MTTEPLSMSCGKGRRLAPLSLAALAVAVLAPRALAQCGEEAKLVDTAANVGGNHGVRVDLQGDVAVCGAFNELNQGRVFVYEHDGSNWVESVLVSGDIASNDAFGGAVSISGDTILVGAPDEDPGISAGGSAYVFERMGNGWLETAKLVASDPGFQDFFGSAVALSGDLAVIGSPEDDDLGSESGSAYVFERSGGVWTQVQKLVAASEGGFGGSLAIEGERIVVGATSETTVASQSGGVYVFERQGGSWVETAHLVASDGAAFDFFGVSVALSGSRVVVGSVHHDLPGIHSCGAVYVFEELSGVWTETAKLSAADAASNDSFGISVDVLGDRVVAGAHLEGTTGSAAGNTGAAYVFELHAGSWTQVTKLTASDGRQNDAFGAVSLWGDRVLVGAPSADVVCADDPPVVCGDGATYVFQVPPGIFASAYCMCVSGRACGGGADTHGGCENSNLQPHGARLSWCGTGSLAADDLVLTATDVKENAFGLFFMGSTQVGVPFGEGLRCVGGGTSGVFRFQPVKNSGRTRSLRLGPGIATHATNRFPLAGHIAPGDTWNFQAWYRDQNGTCGTGFNLSNGVSVLFSP